jgi:hypothetical protein
LGADIAGNEKEIGKSDLISSIPRSSCFILPAGFGSDAGQRQRDKEGEITCAQNALNLPLSLVQSLSHLRHLFFFLCCALYQNAEKEFWALENQPHFVCLHLRIASFEWLIR